MKAADALKHAVVLLGYADSMGDIPQNIRRDGLITVNSVYAELFAETGEGSFVPVTDLGEEINLPEGIAENLLVNGLAALLAAGRGDSVRAQYFARLYDNKKKMLSCEESIQDLMP